MAKRWVIGLVAVVAVIAFGGIGFAAFTASATINGTATAGSFGPLTWGSEPTNTAQVTDASICSAGTASGSSWTSLSGTYFAPGDSCKFSDSLAVGGNLPGSLSESAKFADSATTCGLQYWTYSDSLVGSVTFTSGQGNGPVTVSSSTPMSVTAGQTITFSGQFALVSGAPNGCQGDVLTIGTITITGTAS